MSKDNANDVTDYYRGRHNYDLNEITVADTSALKRTIGSTAIGNFTEWFDFGVYSYVIVILSDQFFPESAGWATVATFAGLAVSFLLRPVGGIFWGILGDRIGRKAVLTFTILMMAFGSFALGLVPSYGSIGIWAPILLFILRGIQGFSTGGEYVHAMTFLVEHAPDNRRGYLASFLPLGTLSGYILGAVIVIIMRAILPHDAMYGWGWRVPFLLAGPLGVIGMYMRLRIEETPVYEQASEHKRMSRKSAVQQIRLTVIEQWRPILIVMGLVLSFNVTNYMLTGYMPTYLPNHLGIADTQALIVVVIVMAIIALMVNMLGKLTDRIGRKPVLLAGSILLIVASIPMFLLIFVGSDIAIFFGTLPMGLMLVCFLSSEPSTLPTLFPTNVRAGSTAIAFNISVSAFGGTTPLIASALVESTGDLLVPAYILIFAGIVGVISIYFLPEPVGRPLPGAGPTVANDEQAQALAATDEGDSGHATQQ